MNYNDRISSDYLKAQWRDGEVLQHVDLNILEAIVKGGINENYYDIQKMLDGTYTVGSAKSVANASLSKLADETLANDDNKIPSALQVKNYVDTEITKVKNNIPTKLSSFTNDKGYIDKTVDDLENYYKKTETYSAEEITTKLATKVTIVAGKDLSSNDFTDALKEKLEGLSNYDDTAIKSSLSNKLDISKVKNVKDTTAGNVYDTTYINSVVGNIEELLGGI